MNLFYYRYQLRSRARLNVLSDRLVHEGALVRTGSGGVGCLHPWPELGDAPLDAQLAALASGQRTPLVAAALRCATLDGAAREAGRSVFEGLKIPASHQILAPGDPADAAFSVVKVKGGEIPETFAHQRLRFDFNGALTREGFEDWARRLPDPGRVDFVEDPYPFDRGAWEASGEGTGLCLALDRGDKAAWPATVVVKPAVEPVPAPGGRRLVVTTYMDHPVGQMFAAYEAARLGGEEIHGLASHRLFERDPFVDEIRTSGDRLLPPAGTGLGFDTLLEVLPWKKI